MVDVGNWLHAHSVVDGVRPAIPFCISPGSCVDTMTMLQLTPLPVGIDQEGIANNEVAMDVPTVAEEPSSVFELARSNLQSFHPSQYQL